MLQEFKSQRGTDKGNSSSGKQSGNNESAMAVDVREVKCCYYMKGQEKLDLCQRKAELMKKRGKGSGAGYEHAYVARTKVATEALVDSQCSVHILSDYSLLSGKRRDRSTTV